MLVLIFFIFISCFFNLTFCDLKIFGNTPNYQLLQMLTKVDKESLDGYHAIWINNVIQSVKNNNLEDDEIIKDFTKYDAQEILKQIINKSDNLNFLSDEVINKLFSDEIVPEIGNKKTDIEYFKQEYVKAHLFETALKVYSITKDHTLLVIGQTPAFLGHMASEINNLAQKKIKSIINIPFSGRPDAIMPRLNPSKRWNWTMESYKEIVTQSRENYFREILKNSGFHPDIYNKSDQKVFILDNSRGPSIASLLTLFVRWYQESKQTMPNFYFICMDYFDHPLDMKMNEDCHFEIDTIFLKMDDDILNLHLDQVSDNLRVQPPFNAYLWKPNLEKFKEQYPRPEAKELMKLYSEYVKTNFNVS